MQLLEIQIRRILYVKNSSQNESSIWQRTKGEVSNAISYKIHRPME